MNLLIVIVNYESAPLVINCLESLVGEVESVGSARVVITDNGSADDSVTQIRSALDERGWGSWVSLSALNQNRGFAGGNNAAIRTALAWANPPTHVMLLNPDTVVQPGSLMSLKRFLAEHDDVGLAGCRLQEFDATPQRSAFRFPTVLSEMEDGFRLGVVTRLLRKWRTALPASDEAHAADWVSGAALIIRREVFDAIGLFDERFFMYYEEVDFCFRARQAGWSCWYVPASRVVHLVGQVSGLVNGRRPTRRPAYWFESRRRYFLKHLGWFRLLLADVTFAIGFAFWRFRRPLQGKPDFDPPYLLWDFIRHSALVKGTRA